MISSELPEILGMSDRIVVIHEWEIKGEFDGDKATQEKLLMRAYQDENKRLESNYGT
jgi:ABC-type sugar transport system ATPase subunit